LKYRGDMVAKATTPGSFWEWKSTGVLTARSGLQFMPPLGIDPTEKARLKAEYISTFERKAIQVAVVKWADRVRNSMDWLLCDVEYAKSYLAKGVGVYDGLVRRGDELKRSFGEIVYEISSRRDRRLRSSCRGDEPCWCDC
jgi:hypothetical protein